MAIGVGTKAGNKALVRLNCRFDFNCIREFRDLYEPFLTDPAITAIEINMGGVEYIDSTALGMLLALRDKAKTARKEVMLGGCRGLTREVLEVANFDRLFSIVE